MNDQYLPLHRRDLHNIPLPTPTVALMDDSPVTYEVSFPPGCSQVSCPVPGCPAAPTSREHFRDHFMRRHDPHHIIILEEGLLPQCPNCGKHLYSVNDAHLASRTCRTLTERRLQRKRLASQALSPEVTFFIDGQPIERVSSYLYLGRVLQANDLDHEAIMARLKQARACWGRIYRLLNQDGIRAQTMARFYLAIVQAVLLFGAETWVISKRDLRLLESFHARCARHMAKMHIRCLPSGDWVYPETSVVLDICGLSPIQTLIARRKTTLLHYAKDHSPLYEACLCSPKVASPAHRLVWW